VNRAWLALHLVATGACVVNLVTRPDDRALWAGLLVLFLFDLVRETETP
jgi:hypothetical protein